jgi:hypothetical protein
MILLMQVGINLAGMAYWVTQSPWHDEFKGTAGTGTEIAPLAGEERNGFPRAIDARLDQCADGALNYMGKPCDYWMPGRYDLSQALLCLHLLMVDGCICLPTGPTRVCVCVCVRAGSLQWLHTTEHCECCVAACVAAAGGSSSPRGYVAGLGRRGG